MHVPRTVMVALTMAALLAGCSDGHPATTKSTADSGDKQVAYARCMRQHGIDMPDPGGSGSLRIQTKKGQTMQDIQAAMTACRSKSPTNGGSAGAAGKSTVDMVAFARCMRQHGIDMADPQPNGGGGFRFSLPRDAQSNPHFTTAEQACAKYFPMAGQLGQK
jgi:hypothetical protein